MPGELLVILVLVLANGLFAGAEIAVISVRPSQVQQRLEKKKHDRAARALLHLQQKPERFLATVQIGITLVSTAAAAFGGASIARSLVPMLERLGFGSRADDVAFGVVVAGIAFLSLVIGELVPKSLALRYPRYAYLVAPLLYGLSRIAKPLVWFLTFCSNLVLRLFGDKTSFTESRVTRDELQQLVKDAAKSGSMDPETSEIAARALELQDVAVAEVMVRPERIVAIPRDAPAREVRQILLEEGHSRMPVYDGERENFVGYVVARDVLAIAWESHLIVLEDILRPLMRVPTTAKATEVLRGMRHQRTQIAIVVDEVGAIAGMVTMEDLVEEVIGDIESERVEEEPDVRIEPDGSALVPGWVPLRKLNRALQIGLPIERDCTTVAGLCLALALMVPQPGTKLNAPDGTTLEVLDASARRVRMVRVLPAKPSDKSADGESDAQEPAA